MGFALDFSGFLERARTFQESAHGKGGAQEEASRAVPSKPSTASCAGSSYSVTFELPDGSLRTVRADAEEHILDAARRSGLDLPSACEQGWDLACAVRVLEGRVDHADARRYFPQDEAAGFALICTGKPQSDLRLVTHQSEAMREHRRRSGLPAPRGSWGARMPRP